MENDGDTRSKKTVERRRKWLWLRRTVKILVLGLFFYLLVRTVQVSPPLFHDLFFNIDPLAGISAMLASRSYIAPMLWGGLTLLAAIVVGRAWCSWICPLGTLLDGTPARRPNPKKPDIPSYWSHIKYFVLFTIILAAIFGSLTLVILDPITLLFRTITSVVIPAAGLLITTVETQLYGIGLLQPAVEWFDGLVRGWLLTEQPFFLANLLIAFLFAAVLALNAVRPRFWCRCLCPLGALLGLVSRFTQLRHRVDGSMCISCKLCAVACPTGAIDTEQQFAASSAECTTCLDCMEICPTRAITFSWRKSVAAHHPYDPSRRRFLAAFGLAVVGAVVLRTVPLFNKTQSLLIRPPGTTEARLLNQCIRCGECAKVCPTGAIQPISSIADWNGLWTPRLVMRLGYCDYSCNACGLVCPTGAITQLSLEEKRRTVIGVAEIDRSSCIPWAEGIQCIVCEEVCPVPRKAVLLQNEMIVNTHGERVSVLLPSVRRGRCTGCGICEQQCPVSGDAAIRVYPIGD
jgi:MauM/NapG family ferredoxin protein